MRQKLILLTLSLGLVFNFLACSDDDDDKKNTSVVGKWKYSKVEAEFKTNKPETDATIKKAIEDMFNANSFGEQLEFQDNGKLVVGDKTSDYQVSGKKLTIAHGDGYATLDFAFKGNNLILYMGAVQGLEDIIKENEGLSGVEVETAVAKIYYAKQ